MLQPTPEGKAIWKATVTSDTGWSHSFTLLRLAPALIWEADERPTPFTGTVVIEAMTDEPVSVDTPVSSEAPESVPATVVQLTAIEPAPSAPAPTTTVDTMDELIALMKPAPTPRPEASASTVTLPALADAQPPSPESKPSPMPAQPDTSTTPSAEHFMAWLKHAIATRKLIINDAKALVHTVDDTVYLVSPGIFQRYAQEHPQTAVFAKSEGQQDWQWLQKRFEKLGLHRKHFSGLNIWTCEVTGPRKSRRLHGYLLSNADTLFEVLPTNNPYLLLRSES